MTYHIIDASSVGTFMDDVRRGIRDLARRSNQAATAYDYMGVGGDALRCLEGRYTLEQLGSSARNQVLNAVIWIQTAIRAAGQPFWVKFSARSEGEAEISHTNPRISGQKINFRFTDEPEGSGWAQLSFNMTYVRNLVGDPIPGDGPGSERTDIVVTPLSGWAEGYVNIRPSDELLEGMPTGIRALATRAAAANAGSGNRPYLNDDGLQFATGSTYPTGQELLTTARNAYRDMVRARLGAGMRVDDEAERRKREEHRAKTKANFEAFVRTREKDTDQHILKLPFVPHGLASSRRWGIEVESGGARGVETPANWEAKGDGSLRSAYDGYVEVQDFEPFDEEVTENIRWQYCPNSAAHQPWREVVDPVHGYINEPNPDYVHPNDCATCGNVTRTVRREPQTIRHEARGGDCREFVSPILTSMHSQGLEALTTALSKNPQNDSAGVHVHVEANDLSKQQIATMVYGYDILEPILEASYRRNRRDFCERRDAEEVLAAARKARGEGVSGSEGGRYRTLNTHSLSSHGTLEFRAMGPVYEYEYLIRWAMLCRELVNSVANGAKPRDFAKIKSWDDLTAFLARFGKEYIRAAVYEMTGEVGEAAKLEKAGEPVTTAALDLDLSNFANGMISVSEAMSNMASHISMFNTITVNREDRLVGAMPATMSEI